MQDSIRLDALRDDSTDSYLSSHAHTGIKAISGMIVAQGCRASACAGSVGLRRQYLESEHELKSAIAYARLADCRTFPLASNQSLTSSGSVITNPIKSANRDYLHPCHVVILPIFLSPHRALLELNVESATFPLYGRANLGLHVFHSQVDDQAGEGLRRSPPIYGKAFSEMNGVLRSSYSL